MICLDDLELMTKGNGGHGQCNEDMLMIIVILVMTGFKLFSLQLGTVLFGKALSADDIMGMAITDNAM